MTPHQLPAASGDTGEPDVAFAAALARYAETGAENPVLALLSSARLLVPVKAVAADAAKGDKDVEGDTDTEISAVLMRGRDGRLALLAFTGVDSLRRWDAEARPVPVSGCDAAASARAHGAGALLVDVAGPVAFVVETAELTELAAEHELRSTSVGYAWFATG